MQRQKTVAKWLAIILLVTIAVGAYIMYDAVYLEGGDTAAGDEPVTPPDTEPDPAPPETDPPFYTTLPRAAQTFAGIKVAHAGGEGDERVLATVFTDGTAYVFFSSESSEYDCRGSGLYLALHDGDSLISVTRFAAGSATFGGAKLTSDGVAAAVSDGGTGTLFVFGTDGSVKGETSLPAFTSAFLLSHGGELMLFLSDGTALTCHTVQKGLAVTSSPFRLAGDRTVTEGFAAGEVFTLSAQRGEDTEIVTFSQENGFIVTECYEKTSFRQIVPVAGEDGAAFCLLGSKASGMLLAVLSASGEELSSATLEGGTEGALFGDGVSVILVRTGLTQTFCRHLDLIASAPTDLEVYGVAAVRESGGKRALVTRDAEGGVEVLLSSEGDDFVTLAECSGGEGNVRAEFLDGDLVISLSSSSRDGIFFENFGAGDAYLLRLPA